MLGQPRTDYEAIAHRYDEHREQWSLPRDDMLAALLDGRRARVAVLDVGCGTGLYLGAQIGFFRGHPIGWVGLDPSSAMLERAHEKGVAATFVRATAERMPLLDQTFDYVHSSYAFHHFVDKPTALGEMDRVLRPGGRIRIVNVEPWSMQDWWVYEFFPETRGIDERRFWPVEKLVAELETRGLVVDASVTTSDVELRLGAALAEAESRSISQLAVLDDDAYARGVERLRAATAPDPDRTIVRRSALVFALADKPA